jgi:hypothetical protein
MKGSELWVLDGKWFKFPYWVNWQDDIAILYSPAAVLLGVQHQAVSDFLKLRGRMVDGKWCLPRHEFANVFEKGEVNRNPDEYVVWTPHKKAQPKTEPIDLNYRISPEADAFIRELHENTGLVPLHVLQQVYFCISRQAREWLINKEKPVDLGFAVLHSSPYRANWRSIITSQFPWLGAAIQNKSKAHVERFLYESGFADALLDPLLLAYDKNPKRGDVIYRGIDVELKKIWYKDIHRHEREKLKLGRTAYLKNVTNTLKRRIQISLRLYTQWLAQIRRSSAKLVEGQYPGSTWLMPFIPKGSVRAKPFPCPDLPAVVDNNLSIKESSIKEPVEKPDAGVSPMPFIQPIRQDVRHGGGDAGRE